VDYLLHLLIIFLLFAILGTSLNLLVGYAGLLSVGHATFFGLGAYGSGLFAYYLGVPFLIGMLLGVVMAVIMGTIVAIPALRVKDEFLVLLTIGFNMVIYGLMVTQVNLTGGGWGMVGIPKPSIFGIRLGTPIAVLPLAIVLFGICFAVSWRITHSPFGRVLKAMRDDEDATRSLGKDVFRFKVLVFVIAAGLAAVAGSIFAHYNAYIEPGVFTVHESILMLAIVVIGGTANLWGSVLAAFLLMTIPELLTFLPGGEMGTLPISAIRVAIFGALLVAFMVYRPQGIMPEHMGNQKSASAYVPMPPLDKKEILGSEREVSNPGAAGNGPVEAPLRIEGLRKHFGGIRAVENVFLDLPQGKVTALIGPNGAGKTTIFNLITGYIKADSGKVYLQGRDITRYPPHKVNHLGMVRSFQEVRIFRGMSVLDNVLVACGNQTGENLGCLFFLPGKVAREEKENRRRAMAYLDFVGLAEKADFVANDVAFAEQKLLAFACLLATGADVLLIDELVSGIDPASIDKVLALVRQLAGWGKTICIIEHNLDVVKGVADSTYFLADGQVIATGTPLELIADPRLAEIYFGA
jgi:branched-chain amino acid transport system permease protein